MPPFRPSVHLLAKSIPSATRTAAREALARRSLSSTLPIVPTCPPSSCPCSATPSGLDIDTKTPLNGTMAAYNKHILIMSGQTDWTSKIEDERDTADWGKFTAELKKAFGRGGEFHDPYMNIPINTCSFKTSTEGSRQSALLFPAFKKMSTFDSNPEYVRDFAKGVLLGDVKNAPHFKTEAIRCPTILICTHGGRDQRCGILGPVLIKEFEAQVKALEGAELLKLQPGSDSNFDAHAVNVGGLSHVGGHKWAGNVIIYIPPEYQVRHEDGSVVLSPLAGKGIWYGRVEPKHVDGIIKQTILGGSIIQEMFRGGIDQNGHPVRI